MKVSSCFVIIWQVVALLKISRCEYDSSQTPVFTHVVPSNPSNATPTRMPRDGRVDPSHAPRERGGPSPTREAPSSLVRGRTLGRRA